ncbi:MAG: diguanylate cyclase [Acidobacteriota bacterium]
MVENIQEISLFDQVVSFIEKEKFVEANLYSECNLSSLATMRRELLNVITRFQLKPVVFAGIQYLGQFSREEKIYMAILESARKLFLFGVPDAEVGPVPGLFSVPLDEGRYTKDVFLVINGTDYYAAMIAKEIRKDLFEEDKNLYKAFITFDRKIINIVISILNSILIEKKVELPPPIGTTDSFLAEVNQKRMKTVIFNSLLKDISILGDQLYNFSAIDSQSGLFNKRYFYLQLIKEVNRFDRKKLPFSLIFFNLKCEQETLNGSDLSPDDAYAAMAEVIKAGIRKSDDFGFKLREGEFAILLAETPEQGAARVAVRIEDSFKTKNIPGVILKIVISEFNRGKTIKSILEYAEKRLREM